MPKNYLLIDIYQNHNYDFIHDYIEVPIVEVKPSKAYNHKYKAWIVGCLKVIKCSSKNDTIICVFDFQAVLCSLLCSLLFLKRKFICINIMLKDKDTFKNKLVSLLYKRALKRKKFIATVTSPQYGEWLNRKLGTHVNFVLLHDVFHERYLHQYQAEIKNSVFCGGWNGRDWNFMLDVARAMPDESFTLVMHTGVKEELNADIPPNVNLHTSISSNQFYQLMCESALVCLPLNTEAPAGLLVFFHAAANKRMVITTDTVTTREYIGKDRGVALKNNVDDWVTCIRHLLTDTKQRETYANNMLCFLKNECSENSYVKVINKLICDNELEEED